MPSEKETEKELFDAGGISYQYLKLQYLPIIHVKQFTSSTSTNF